MDSRQRLTGVGLGLRWEFLAEVVDGPELDVAFFEVSPENYMRRGGYYPAALERVRARYPIVTHGLALSLGGSSAPDEAYWRELAAEVRRLGTPWHSDHLAFTQAGPYALHELMPVPRTVRNARRVAERLREAEDRLQVPMAIENISWYAELGRPELDEAEFLGRILQESGAGLLLDVNNVYVNASNHDFDARAFITALPLERVRELHVAGHAPNAEGVIIDTHGTPVCEAVLELLEFTLERVGPVPVLLERDNAIPPLAELLAEVRALARVYDGALARRAASRAEESGGERRA